MSDGLITTVAAKSCLLSNVLIRNASPKARPLQHTQEFASTRCWSREPFARAKTRRVYILTCKHILNPSTHRSCSDPMAYVSDLWHPKPSPGLGSRLASGHSIGFTASLFAAPSRLWSGLPSLTGLPQRWMTRQLLAGSREPVSGSTLLWWLASAYCFVRESGEWSERLRALDLTLIRALVQSRSDVAHIR